MNQQTRTITTFKRNDEIFVSEKMRHEKRKRFFSKNVKVRVVCLGRDTTRNTHTHTHNRVD